MNDGPSKLPNLGNLFANDLARTHDQLLNSMRVMESVQRQRAEREEQLAGRNDAKELFDYLMLRVRDFEGSLKDDAEIGLQLANFGLAAQLHIRAIGYRNPNLIEFVGIDANGHEATLIQHISQLNFLLIAVKPFKEEPYRIGYR